MTTDLFNANSTANDPQTQANPNQNQNTDPNILNDLVGPGKKFASVEALALGKKTSDEFISRLQQEMQGLREELNRRTSAEDIIKQVREEFRQTSQEATPASNGLDENTIAQIVKNQLTEATLQTQAIKNLEMVNEAMLSQFQSDEAAKEAITTKARELGVTVEYLRDNAMQSPKAFLALMGLQAQTKTTTPSAPAGELQKSSQNSEALPPVNDAAKVKEYYDNLRRTSPSKYWAPETQKQIWTLMQQGKYVTE